jgi:molybdate transport system substrate-binding protein
MGQWVKRFLVAALIGVGLSAHADSITVAAAADLRHALDALVATFKREAPGDVVNVVYGSSGKFMTQIQQGAPFDLYFSADIAYPTALVAAGLAVPPVERYAQGRLVLWSTSVKAADLSLGALADPKFIHIAMADPEHAPYGKRAQEALVAVGLWDKVRPKLVYGENVAQAAQFVQTGNAQVGLVALSLVSSPDQKAVGAYIVIPEKLHQPLVQGFVVTKQGAQSALARRFAVHVSKPMSRSIMASYGFVLPSAE